MKLGCESLLVTIDRFEVPNSVRVLVLTSPKAGSGAGRDELPRLVRLLDEAGVECRLISEIGTLRTLLAEASESLESPETIVVAAGGDGTLALAAATIAPVTDRPAMVSNRSARAPETSNASPLLLPMPMGTENLLARQFGFTRVAEDVCRTIRHGEIRPIDAGLANGQLFLIMATSGFDADVVRRLHLKRRGHISRLSYLWPILRSIRKYSFPKIRIRVDSGPPIECAWAMVFNLPQYGGRLLIEPGAVDNDGLFDVIAFRRGSFAGGLRYVMQIWLGRHLKNDSVVRVRGTSVRIESDARVPFQLDGDYAGKLPLQIDMLPQAVRLLMPTRP